MSEELMVKVEDVYKRYRLGTIGGGTLTGDLQSWWAKVRGKEDPNSKIGAKVYGKNEVFYALNGISFEVKKGEALGIIGGNGAGKSTTLKLLSQVTAPTAGKIYLNGRITSMLEVGTGFHPELTGRENIYMNGAILGMTKAEIDKKIEAIIEFSECRQFIDTPVKRYSSGMYVKLAFSVAAHLDSEIMIMDEVLAVGDMAFQKKCIDKMVGLSKEEGRTILYVSHNMNTIRQLCDRCIVLDKGQVVFEGDVEKGIEFYLGSTGNSMTEMFFDDNQRRADITEDLRFKSIKLENMKEWVFNTGSKIRFSICVEAKKDLKEVGYRSRLTTMEGQSITVLLAPKLFSIAKNERKILELEADISILAPGRYYFTLTLYGANEYGGWQFYDHLDRAVAFEVVQTDGFNENMKWEQRWWGNVCFPPIIKIDERTM